METVYILTYRSGEEETRRAMELSSFNDIIPALLRLGVEDAEDCRVFRAELMKS